MDDRDRGRPFDQSDLVPLLRCALDDTAEILDFTWTVLRATDWASVYRVGGIESPVGKSSRWSLIVKVLRLRAGEDNREREAHAYGSGFFARLPPPLTAPRCFASATLPDRDVGLCLEDVFDSRHRDWPLARFARVARLLGRAQGTYLVGRPLPDDVWLSRDFLRSQVDGWDRERLPIIRDRGRWDHPLARDAFPTGARERLLAFWDRRERLLRALDRLPRVLCHHDFQQDNIFERSNRASTTDLVLIDWSDVGPGPVGADLAQLVGYGLMTFTIEVARLPQYDRRVFAAYLRGLAETGWTGNPDLPRLGFVGALALRRALHVPQLSLLNDPTRYAAAERDRRRPIEQIAAAHGAMTRTMIDFIDEAEALVEVF